MVSAIEREINMSNFAYFTPRPEVVTWVRWAGDNKAELESYFSGYFGVGVTFSVDGSGNLVLDENVFTNGSPTVSAGFWFRTAAAGGSAQMDPEEFPGTILSREQQILGGPESSYYGIANAGEL